MRITEISGLITFALAGVLIGIGGYSFIYARGYSYLSNDPKACINCHIMQSNYDSWSKSGHQHVAKCNDCHLPHESFYEKYYSKARNGFAHGWAFTSQNFPDPIRIKAHNREITQKSCLNCHQPMVQAMNIVEHNNSSPKDCLHCHRSVGHGK